MEISGPRLRSLLRQAERVAESGKLAAAADLYHQIISEAPESVDAWLGLANVSQDPAEKEKAYQQVLTLDPENGPAQRGLARLNGEDVPEPEVVEPEPEPVVETPALSGAETAVVEPEAVAAGQEHTDHNHAAVTAEEFDLVCYRHPDRTTSLRCYHCSKPICIDCTNKTPVGYLCPDCFKEKEDAFFNNKPIDNLIALVIALPLSLLAGYLLTLFGRGFFIWLIIFFAGGAVGSFIGRMTKRAIGNRRGRYIPYLVAGSIIVGVAIFALPVFFLTGSFTVLIAPGIFLFIATPAAFYWSR